MLVHRVCILVLVSMLLFPVQAYSFAQSVEETKIDILGSSTGWSGGPYGIGKRIKIKYSRAMVTAALSGKLDDIPYNHDELFNLDIPTKVNDVPSEILDPKNTWDNKDSYDHSAKKLAQMFVENFKKFENVSSEIVTAGPKPAQ